MRVSQKFSVIIPSQNEGFWLEKTVKGVLENTNYPDFEIIVVADFCSDGSADFLKQKNFPNVKLIETPKLEGSIKTRNSGAREAEGEFWYSLILMKFLKQKIGYWNFRVYCPMKKSEEQR